MLSSITTKPKYLISFTLSLALILIIVTVADIYQSRNELYNAKNTEAVSLIQAIQKSGENVYISNEEIENLIAEKLLTIDADRLLEFRRKAGIGALFQNIAHTEEISYLVIQDQDGIIVASKGITELNAISDDPFLTEALNDNKISSREYEYLDKELLEVVKPFTVEGDVLGLIRVGISLESLDAMLHRSIVRSILISVFMLLTGVIVFVLISRNQKYSLLQNDYKRIQTYTGNILENMSDSVIAADKNGRINLFNSAAEKLFEISADEVIGKYCSAVIKSPETLIDKTVRENQSVEYYEQLCTTHNNRQIILGGASSVIRDSESNIDTVIAVFRDLTSLRHNEELQKRREKLSAMGELAAGVAHEIKNPLNSIGITVQRFQKEFAPAEDKEEYLELISNVKSEIQRVTDIINQFLAFARPPKINKISLNVKEFIEDICRSYQSQAAAAGVTLTCTAEDIQWCFDYSQMKQVMINLIQNAFDAVQSNAVITVESFIRNNNLIILVSDNGKGINTEDIPKIFNLYFTTKSNGTGLGLGIVNQIVQEHNGTIKVESEINKGTKFIIELPNE